MSRRLACGRSSINGLAPEVAAGLEPRCGQRCRRVPSAEVARVEAHARGRETRDRGDDDAGLRPTVASSVRRKALAPPRPVQPPRPATSATTAVGRRPSGAIFQQICRLQGAKADGLRTKAAALRPVLRLLVRRQETARPSPAKSVEPPTVDPAPAAAPAGMLRSTLVTKVRVGRNSAVRPTNSEGLLLLGQAAKSCLAASGRSLPIPLCAHCGRLLVFQLQPKADVPQVSSHRFALRGRGTNQRLRTISPTCSAFPTGRTSQLPTTRP